jgi:uncharacterized membrane-anchored protein YitT (DUF2179 family)
MKKLSLFSPQEQSLPAKKKIYEIFRDFAFYILGSMLYSASVSVFTAPNKIAPGGVTGVSTILHYAFGLPIGVMIFVLNIPLFLLAMRFIGGRFIVRTVICTALISAFIDIFGILPRYEYTGNMLLASLYGGLIAGSGLGLIFLRGATTGGTDTASKLIRLRYPYIPMGRIMMAIDLMVVLAAAIYFRSVNDALYAIITIFVSSKVIDSILYGSDTGRMVMIVSEKNEELANCISEEVNRGITILKGRGYYSGAEKDVIMCAVRRSEAPRLRAITRRIDPSAFIIMCEAGDVIGEGFKPINKMD